MGTGTLVVSCSRRAAAVAARAASSCVSSCPRCCVAAAASSSSRCTSASLPPAPWGRVWVGHRRHQKQPDLQCASCRSHDELLTQTEPLSGRTRLPGPSFALHCTAWQSSAPVSPGLELERIGKLCHTLPGLMICRCVVCQCDGCTIPPQRAAQKPPLSSPWHRGLHRAAAAAAGSA